jgi:glucokinase
MDASDPPLSSRHLGLDLGATNLKWVVVERTADEWTVVARDHVATRITPDHADTPDAVVAQLAEVGADAAAGAGPIATAGIGIPGLYDPVVGSVRFLVNLPGPWAGQPVVEPVGRALGVPVSLINDARAFGLAELRLGAGRGAVSMIGFTLGTGVGGVIAIDGRVHQGHDGTAGEMGHQTLDPDGPSCNCGNFGCLEAFARADRIAEACCTATAEEAFTRARAGDARARSGLDRVARHLGIGIANMVTAITPDRVVIGGGIAAAADLLFDPIRDELARRVRTTSLDEVQLVTAELGTWAGAIGAAIHGAEMAATGSKGAGEARGRR